MKTPPTSGINRVPGRFSPIPIVDNGLHIVGWTFEAPTIRLDAVFHEQAESRLGERVQTRQVQIVVSDDMERAGAPPDWTGPWRCFAICSMQLGHMKGLDEFPTVASVETPKMVPAPIPAVVRGRKPRRAAA